MKINIQAWEQDDVTDGDDQMPEFIRTWSTTKWHGYIGDGWIYITEDTDDCIYYIRVRIDLAYSAIGGGGGGGGGPLLR